MLLIWQFNQLKITNSYFGIFVDLAHMDHLADTFYWEFWSISIFCSISGFHSQCGHLQCDILTIPKCKAHSRFQSGNYFYTSKSSYIHSGPLSPSPNSLGNLFHLQVLVQLNDRTPSPNNSSIKTANAEIALLHLGGLVIVPKGETSHQVGTNTQFLYGKYCISNHMYD